MKDGRVFFGPLYRWAPKEGWFTLSGIDETIVLDDVRKAVNRGIRITIDKVVDIDLVKRARDEGWRPGVRPVEGFDGWKEK